MDDLNISRALHGVAAGRGDEEALVVRGSRYSFAQLSGQAGEYAARLHGGGVRRGDRVMLMVRPSMEFICLTFALFELGAVVILIDPGMGYRNLLRCIASVRPDVLVAIPRGILFSLLFPAPFRTVRVRIRVGRGPGPGRALSALPGTERIAPFQAEQDDPAAIIFTTGSTGPPKGVRYTHGIFHAQLRLIAGYYGIGPGEVDQPAFPLFALFSTALGARAVIPDMDPSRPARVNPKKFIRTLIDEQVTYSFGSPAIWKVVSRYCLERGITLPVRKVLMAGAPVAGELIEQVQRILPENAQVHTPYGATESLPVASIEGREVVGECMALTRQGRGVCVGRPLPGITVAVIRPQDGEIASWDEAEELERDAIGEIVVKGAVVTPGYEGNETETRMAKIADGTGIRHRMGDMGYLDAQGRLWFCGRKAHVVHTKDGPLYTICCEGIFNTCPGVVRSALVGVGKPGEQQPVLLVEKEKSTDEAGLLTALDGIARKHRLTWEISTFLVHPGFPVDIRHNAKIFREKLALWAAKKLHVEGCEDGL